MTDPLPFLVVYTRPGCHLCEDAHVMLDALLADRAARGLAAPPVAERNIDDDPDLRSRYGLTIPVVAFGHRELELATSPAKLGRFLAEVLDGAPAETAS